MTLPIMEMPPHDALMVHRVPSGEWKVTFYKSGKPVLGSLHSFWDNFGDPISTGAAKEVEFYASRLELPHNPDLTPKQKRRLLSGPFPKTPRESGQPSQGDIG